MAATKAKMEQAAETKKAAPKAAGVKVTVVQNYYDLQLKVIKHAGDVFEVSKDRAAQLESLKLVQI